MSKHDFHVYLKFSQLSLPQKTLLPSWEVLTAHKRRCRTMCCQQTLCKDLNLRIFHFIQIFLFLVRNFAQRHCGKTTLCDMRSGRYARADDEQFFLSPWHIPCQSFNLTRHAHALSRERRNEKYMNAGHVAFLATFQVWFIFHWYFFYVSVHLAILVFA